MSVFLHVQVREVLEEKVLFFYDELSSLGSSHHVKLEMVRRDETSEWCELEAFTVSLAKVEYRVDTHEATAQEGRKDPFSFSDQTPRNIDIMSNSIAVFAAVFFSSLRVTPIVVTEFRGICPVTTQFSRPFRRPDNIFCSETVAFAILSTTLAMLAAHQSTIHGLALDVSF